MSKIHVVMGSTGEYSDRSEWPVRAFASEEKAKELVASADRAAKELAVTTQGMDWKKASELLKQNKLDPDVMIDYTGTTYYYMTVELEA
jgi:hypothetical protein